MFELRQPAKRAWLEKQQGELRVLERESKLHRYNLDHPKELKNNQIIVEILYLLN